MFPDIRPGTTANTAGWTCAICGIWVPINTHHTCGGSPTIGDFSAVSGEPIGTVELRLKLDEIIELLEKISRRVL